MNSQIVEIQKRIELRSKKLRSDYLNKISFAAEQSQSARKNMGCSNIAHAFASCDKAQQGEAAEGAEAAEGEQPAAAEGDKKDGDDNKAAEEKK